MLFLTIKYEVFTVRIFSKLFIFLMCLLCVATLIAFAGDFSASYAIGAGGYRGISLYRDRYSSVDEVYLGGIPVGISLLDRGLIVVGITEVITDGGAISPANEAGVRVNDIILELDGQCLYSAEQLARIINTSESTINLKLKRNKEILEIKITPHTDVLSKQRKIGIFVKEGLDGVGTLTFARADKKRFGALGHAIVDQDTKMLVEMNSGALYSCVIEGYIKGAEGKAGALKGVFNKELSKISIIDNNTSYGLYGTYDERLIKDRPKVKTGSRDTVRPGKAYIVTTISGNNPAMYEIEIIKTAYQNSPAEKSMIIRVTDQTLLKTTGGIVQGMSGSPIVQNEKIIGAVTHVFINDPTKGYGLYIDWMLEN